MICSNIFSSFYFQQPFAAEWGQIPALVIAAESREADGEQPEGGLYGEPEQADRGAQEEAGDAPVLRQDLPSHSAHILNSVILCDNELL